jgi:hypothetical protein
MWGLCWTKRHWGRFSPSISVSPANHHSTNCSIIIITRGWHNRPIWWPQCRVEPTELHTPLYQLKNRYTKKKRQYMWHRTSFRNINTIYRSRDSVVGIATGYGLDDRGVGVRVPVIFSSPSRPDRLWGPPNLLPNG